MKLLLFSVVLFCVICPMISDGGVTCNGMAEFCNLTLPQTTFAGTHNSGAGFDGMMYYHTPVGSIVALSCFYRNQDQSITRQLDDGIRYLDIDSCWESSSRWTVGAWSCHSGAYGGSINKLLNQVNAWMMKNRNEVIVLHFNRDTVDPDKTGAHIARMIEERWGPNDERRMRNSLMVNDRRRRSWQWPTLGQAVESNQRIFVFFDGKLIAKNGHALYYRHRWIHASNGEIGLSWKPYGLIESKGCSKLANYIKDKCGRSGYYEFMEVDLSLTWGLCVEHLADYCNRYADEVTRACAEQRAKNARGTANFICVDWQSRASGRNKVRDVARRQNIRNVKYFLGKDVTRA